VVTSGQAGSPSRLTRREATVLIASALLAGPRAVSTARAATPKKRPKVPSKGFNLPGWVDRTPGSKPTRAVLEKLHDSGFRTVRLPVSANTIVGVDAADRTAMLGRIRSAIDELVAIGYSVIVDLHPDGDFGRLLH